MFAPKLLLCTSLLVFAFYLDQQPGAGGGAESSAASPAWTFTGPLVHERLAIYLVHGADAAGAQQFLTLQEAVEQKKIRVRETGEVNALEVENLSDEQIFIQGGDIVRGGKQDRILGTDLILAPHSGQVPIRSFCVEQGRWTGRRGESADYFHAAENQAPQRSVVLPAKQMKDQRAVWAGVRQSQGRLREALHDDVTNPASPTSLELTLEDEQVKERVGQYSKALTESVTATADVLGVVVVINGSLCSADIYGSHGLFVKLWPKLLEAAAVEAIASANEPPAAHLPTTDEARAFVDAALEAKAAAQDVSPRVHLIVRENEQQVRFDTLDTENARARVHVNCIRKPAPATQPAAPQREP